MSFTITAKDAIKTLEKTICNETINNQCNEIASYIREADQKGKLVVIFGNGGSAADAQHFAGELVCTYRNKNRKPYRAIALTLNTSVITAWSNDFHYEEIFQRQIDAFSDSIGLAIGLSTSGTSKNVLLGLAKAKSYGIKTSLICGDCKTNELDIDYLISIPSRSTPTIQTVTEVIYHSICENLE